MPAALIYTITFNGVKDFSCGFTLTVLKVSPTVNHPMGAGRMAQPANDKAKLHHVYCDASDAAVVTPCFTDADRAFKRLCRENPEDEVTWDRVDEFDPELGAFGSVRFMVSVPSTLHSDENVYGLASIQQSIEEDRAR